MRSQNDYSARFFSLNQFSMSAAAETENKNKRKRTALQFQMIHACLRLRLYTQVVA